MTFYKIADVCFKAAPKYDFNIKAFEPYRCEGEAEFEIGPLGKCEAEENELLLRELCARFMSRGIIMLHSSAIIYKEKAYLFAAPSGTGKTTHILLWKKLLGDRVQILNGDKPFVKITGDGAFVYGGPWQGKERLGINKSAKLGGIFFLNRDTVCRLQEAAPNEKLIKLLNATFTGSSVTSKTRLVTALDTLQKSVPIMNLYCDISENAVKVVKDYVDKGTEL